MVQTRSGKRVEFPSRDKPLQWGKLPLIVQELVLKELAGDYDRYLLEDRQCRANYAAVSPQWQRFFEKLNFRKLVLHPSALREFRKIVRRRSYNKKPGKKRQKNPETAADESSSPSRMPPIRHIWLHVNNLQCYYCGRCKREESGEEYLKNNQIFTTAVYNLLDILSRWEKRDPNHKQDLTLELSAQSKSDSRHYFRGDAGLQPEYPNLGPVSAQRDYIMRYEQDITSGKDPLNDPVHGYSAGQFTGNATSLGIPYRPQSAAERVIKPLDFDFFPSREKRFPEVKMISSFVLRRQFYRELEPRAFGILLHEALTGLRNIRYERRRLPDPTHEGAHDMGFGPTETEFGPPQDKLLGGNLPSSLEVLSLFEDRSIRSPSPGSLNWIYGDLVSCYSQIRVLGGLAGRADNLKHLSVSFMSDAIDCFKFPADAFPNLLSLAITSKDLKPDDGKVRKILLQAAIAVRKLPKLQIMELWNCKKGRAAILRYEAAHTGLLSHTCELTWRSSWASTKSTIGTGVMKAWEETAQKASSQLIFTLEPLPPDPYTKYGAILHHLKLRDFILDPISAMQARVGLDAENQPEVQVWKESLPYAPGQKTTVVDLVGGGDNTKTQDEIEVLGSVPARRPRRRRGKR